LYDLAIEDATHEFEFYRITGVVSLDDVVDLESDIGADDAAVAILTSLAIYYCAFENEFRVCYDFINI
jgi:hypothetical protein